MKKGLNIIIFKFLNTDDMTDLEIVCESIKIEKFE